MIQGERPTGLEIPCGQTLGHGERCQDGYMCDQCAYIIELEERISYLEHEFALAADRIDRNGFMDKKGRDIIYKVVGK